MGLVPLADVAHDVLHEGYCIGLLYHWRRLVDLLTQDQHDSKKILVSIFLFLSWERLEVGQLWDFLYQLEEPKQVDACLFLFLDRYGPRVPRFLHLHRLPNNVRKPIQQWQVGFFYQKSDQPQQFQLADKDPHFEFRSLRPEVSLWIEFILRLLLYCLHRHTNIHVILVLNLLHRSAAFFLF